MGPAGHIYMPGTGRAVGHAFLSSALAGEQVGLRELEDNLWLVSFLYLDLGLLDLRTSKVRPIDLTA